MSGLWWKVEIVLEYMYSSLPQKKYGLLKYGLLRQVVFETSCISNSFYHAYCINLYLS